MGSVLFIVDPVPSVRGGREAAMEVPDVDFVARVDRKACGTLFIFAQLKFSWSNILAEDSFGVLSDVESQMLARSSSEEIAFAC